MRKLNTLARYFWPIALLLGCVAQPNPKPGVSLSAWPPTTPPGGTVVLTWHVTGADDVTIDNSIGRVPPEGQTSVVPAISSSGTATYTLTARNAGRSSAASCYFMAPGASIGHSPLPSASTCQVKVAPLEYSSMSAVYTAGTAIQLNTPVQGNEAVASYSVAPPLPPGLSLDPNTGIISGTPESASDSAVYVVTGTMVDPTTSSFVVTTSAALTMRVLGIVTVVAGVPSGQGSLDGTGPAARFNRPKDVAVGKDELGNIHIYVADYANFTIRAIDASGVVTTVAGTPGTSGSTDGIGSTAQFYAPSGLAADGAGDLFIAEAEAHRIREFTPDGRVTTLAGDAGASGCDDGALAEARFDTPMGLAVDGLGNVYVADTGCNAVRVIAAAGQVRTLAGGVSQSGIVDGSAFNSPSDVAVDDAGNVYVADTDNHVIRKITDAGEVLTFAGTPGVPGGTDGLGSAALFRNPSGLFLGERGVLYVADTGNNAVRTITSDGTVTTLAGKTFETGNTDGEASKARFYAPTGLAVDDSGSIYVADTNNNAIRKITSTATGEVVTTLAGTVTEVGSHDGTGSEARFFVPSGLTVDGSGNIYVADSYNHTIRKVTPSGEVVTLAGSPGLIGSADGNGSAARFYYPSSVALDGAGNLYVADAYNCTIRKVSPAGDVTTFAGSARQWGSTDGTGSEARFFVPSSVAVDRAGNVYVADMFNNLIREITPGGIVTTLAGNAENSGYEDGTGADAWFDWPSDLAVDDSGNVYVADQLNSTIRKVAPDGSVITLAGDGHSGTADGLKSLARFNFPSGLAVDGLGNLYVADFGNNAVRKVASDGEVTTVVGAPSSRSNVPGTLPASIIGPRGVAIGPNQNLYIVLDSAVLEVLGGLP